MSGPLVERAQLPAELSDTVVAPAASVTLIRKDSVPVAPLHTKTAAARETVMIGGLCSATVAASLPVLAQPSSDLAVAVSV